MNWHDRPNVLKGDVVEALMDWVYAQGSDVYVYKAPDQPHCIDRVMICPRCCSMRFLEYKARQPRRWYPDVGLPEKDYANYKFLWSVTRGDILLWFVDTDTWTARYGWFSELNQTRNIEYSGRHYSYPWRTEGFVYFPLEAMTHSQLLPADRFGPTMLSDLLRRVQAGRFSLEKAQGMLEDVNSPHFWANLLLLEWPDALS